MRARSSPGCRGLAPALRDLQTPALRVAGGQIVNLNRHPQRDRPTKPKLELELPITVGTDAAGWARQRRLERPAWTGNAEEAISPCGEDDI
jgi:hypothetical protein